MVSLPFASAFRIFAHFIPYKMSSNNTIDHGLMKGINLFCASVQNDTVEGAQTKYTIKIAVDEARTGKYDWKMKQRRWTVTRTWSQLENFLKVLKSNPQLKYIQLECVPNNLAPSYIQGFCDSILKRNLVVSCVEAREFFSIPSRISHWLTVTANLRETILKVGHMKKQGNFVKSWKRRNFTLHANWLLRYHDSNGVQKGAIDLVEVEQFITFDEPAARNPFMFKLITPTREWKLICDSLEEFNAWTEAITSLRRGGLDMDPVKDRFKHTISRIHVSEKRHLTRDRSY